MVSPPSPNAPVAPGLLADAIERRTTYLVRQFLLAVEVLFADPDADTFRTSPTRTAELDVTRYDLDRFAAQWAALVPDDPRSRAALFHELSQRYPLKAQRVPNLQRVLGLADPAVHDAYHAQFEQTIERAFVDTDPAHAHQHTTNQINFLDLVVQNDLQQSMEWRFLPRGEMLFDEGDPGDSLYIITSGNMRVEKRQPDGTYQLLAERGVGRIIGEMAVITDDTRSARLVAARDSELIRFGQDDFNELTTNHPQIMLSMTQIIIRRFRETLAARPATRTMRTVAFVPLGEPQPAVVAQVTRHLRLESSALHLTHATLDKHAFDGASAALDDPFLSRSVTTWLNEAEERYDYILFETDTTDSAWTQRALLQADHIFLLARGDGDPAPYPIETILDNPALADIPTELLIVYPDGTASPRRTRAWLDARPWSDDYYNLRDNADGIARLARRIAGKMVGLVFGGGALRAYAHGGVYQAMLAEGITVDYVGGTSAGAIAAALVALEMEPPEMRTRVEQGLTRFMDYTLPLIALTTGKRITENLHAIFGDHTIEDQFVKFYCVATNASTAEEVVFTAGILWRALRASSSLPGVFPPVIADNTEGDLLVDGAVLNNVPSDIMRQRCPGVVIVVDVSEAKKTTGRRYNHGDYISGVAVLLNRMNPLRRKRIKGPNMARFLSRLSYISSMKDRASRQSDADILILPDVGQYSIFDEGASEAMFAAGEVAGQAALAAWHAQHPGWVW
jgi:predicted acylesterase/phospholipase RssA/CRP-like cAMP-binding protein